MFHWVLVLGCLSVAVLASLALLSLLLVLLADLKGSWYWKKKL
jgi:hypothetical protein